MWFKPVWFFIVICFHLVFLIKLRGEESFWLLHCLCFIFRLNACRYPAPRRKARRYLHPSWPAGTAQILENLICQGFVKDTPVAVALHIKLQRFQLDASFIWAVLNCYLPKIRLTGSRAHTGKLRTAYRNMIISLRIRVVEQLKADFFTHCLWLAKI